MPLRILPPHRRGVGTVEMTRSRRVKNTKKKRRKAGRERFHLQIIPDNQGGVVGFRTMKKVLTHAEEYIRAREKLDCPRGNLKKLRA
jgi:hypothetical protein